MSFLYGAVRGEKHGESLVTGGARPGKEAIWVTLEMKSVSPPIVLNVEEARRNILRTGSVFKKRASNAGEQRQMTDRCYRCCRRHVTCSDVWYDVVTQ